MLVDGGMARSRKWIDQLRSGLLLIHVVQYPDAAGDFGECYDQAVLRKRKIDSHNLLRNHETRTIKFGYGKRWILVFSGGIEVNPENVIEATASRAEIDCLSIGGPSRFVVPVLAVGIAKPGPSGY